MSHLMWHNTKTSLKCHQSVVPPPKKSGKVGDIDFLCVNHDLNVCGVEEPEHSLLGQNIISTAT